MCLNNIDNGVANSSILRWYINVIAFKCVKGTILRICDINYIEVYLCISKSFYVKPSILIRCSLVANAVKQQNRPRYKPNKTI